MNKRVVPGEIKGFVVPGCRLMPRLSIESPFSSLHGTAPERSLSTGRHDRGSLVCLHYLTRQALELAGGWRGIENCYGLKQFADALIHPLPAGRRAVH